MKRRKATAGTFLSWFFLLLFFAWAAIFFASCFYKGISLDDYINAVQRAIFHPFDLKWTEHTKIFLSIFGLIYLAFAAYAQSLYLKRSRHGEEHGSAKWGTVNEINRITKQEGLNNRILSKRILLGLDMYIHGLNTNMLVIGGSGSGKTRYVAKPNIMQCNSSFVVTDPKGELLRDTGYLLKMNGYDVRVLNLVDLTQSDGYNPLSSEYIKDDKDVMKLITNLIKNTTPKNASLHDPFWEKSEIALLQAIIFYLFYEVVEEDCNFGMVMRMLDYVNIQEEGKQKESELDLLFKELEKEEPNHIAVLQYRIFKQAPAKTALSIVLSLQVRLSVFNIKQVNSLTCSDELYLSAVGDKKTAIFAVIPDNDKSFNFLVGMLYTQLFQTLYFKADNVYKGRLPEHVHCIMDEFANVSLPDDFESIESTCRSRNIGVSIIIQNLAQIKSERMFKDLWESIVGNCDTIVYLGGNEYGTHEYLSKILGKETIDVREHSLSRGQSSSFSNNDRMLARELLQPNEVRLVDRGEALVIVSGKPPVIDKKYRLQSHPNYSLTADGGSPKYKHKPDVIKGLSLSEVFDLSQNNNFRIVK